MADIKELKELALHAARGTAPANFTSENVNDAFIGELSALCTGYHNFEKNKHDIYQIVEETIDEIVPNKVISALSPFAEVKMVPQGQKATFRVRRGKNRAKKFLTQVGLSGVYETFRLDTATFDVAAHAVGGAATIDFERMLDGAEDLAEVMAIVTEGLEDAAYLEVQKALIAAANASNRPAANKVTVSAWDADAMVKLCNVVKAYGTGATIFATPEFISAMGPDQIVPVAVAGAQGIYSPDDIDAIHKTGYINIFRGNTIVEIPQSFIDENNDKTWINPQYAYVLPTGGEKIVKIVFEGATQLRDWDNKDGSKEVHVYKKMGSAVLTNHNWGIYQNTGITDTSDHPYGY